MVEANAVVTITFPDRETEKRALAFLLGRFSGRVLRSGEHLVPEAALEALADQNIEFTVKGKKSKEHQTGATQVDNGKAQPNPHTHSPGQPAPISDHLPREGESQADEGNAASIALLESWLAEDATNDPEEIRKAQEDLDEFKQAINAERERGGLRRVYP
jgi:hypothetical protein